MLLPDRQAMSDFLSLGYPQQLVAIPNDKELPDGWPTWTPMGTERKIPCATIAHWVDDIDNAVEWALTVNTNRVNVYFSANLPTPNLRRKASKEDIRYALCMYVDKDPDPSNILHGHAWTLQEILKPHVSIPGAPTIVIDSGGGHQGLWMLGGPYAIDGDMTRVDEYERRNYGLELAVQGDRCRNIDRVLRLPGSVNWPNAKKRAKGRVPKLARLAVVNDGAFYDFDSFPAVDLPIAPKHKVELGNIPRITPDTLACLVANPVISRLIKNGPNRNEDRSGQVWRVCCRLIKLGLTNEIVFSIITDPQYKISDHILEQNDPTRAALRAIERVHERLQWQ